MSPCLFCKRLSMLNASSSKFNSSTRGALHFTRQQDLVKLLPHWGSFTFRPRYQVWQCQFIISISLHMFLKWSFSKWSQMNAISSRLMGISEQQNCVLCSLCLILLTTTVNQAKMQNPINRCFTDHQVTLLKRLCCCRASWGNQSCFCMANARVYQVQVLIILSWRWSQCQTSTMSK